MHSHPACHRYQCWWRRPNWSHHEWRHTNSSEQHSFASADEEEVWTRGRPLHWEAIARGSRFLLASSNGYVSPCLQKRLGTRVSSGVFVLRAGEHSPNGLEDLMTFWLYKFIGLWWCSYVIPETGQWGIVQQHGSDDRHDKQVTGSLARTPATSYHKPRPDIKLVSGTATYDCLMLQASTL